MLLLFRHLSGSERELVAEAEGDGGGVLPGEGLELGAGLVRVYRSCVINLAKVQEVGSGIILMTGCKTIPISDSYRFSLMNIL